MAAQSAERIYNFQRFGAQETAAPQLEQKNKDNVVALPQEGLKKSLRKRVLPLQSVMRIVGVLAVCFALAYVVYGQMELTELNDQINAATAQLEETRSVELQLQYTAGRDMTAAEIEEYASTYLGMQKIDPGQITYIELADGNGGTVVQDVSKPWYMQIWDTIMEFMS